MPKVSAIPATATRPASSDQPGPSGPTTAESEAIVPITPSPRAMMISRP